MTARPFVAAAVLAVLLAAADISAQPGKPSPIPQRMLFVGNSLTAYNGGMHEHLRQLAQAGDKWNAPYYQVKAITVPGAFLHQHLPALSEALREPWPWDIVVLQGESTEAMPDDAARSERFRSSVRLFDRSVRDARSRTVLFMTWGYYGKPEMTRPIADAYKRVGEETGALVVPVGLAFERAQEEVPLLAVLDTDARHPTPEGTYLAACVFYGALYKKSPEALPYFAGMRKETAASLQRVAWTTVKAYYNW